MERSWAETSQSQPIDHLISNEETASTTKPVQHREQLLSHFDIGIHLLALCLIYSKNRHDGSPSPNGLGGQYKCHHLLIVGTQPRQGQPILAHYQGKAETAILRKQSCLNLSPPTTAPVKQSSPPKSPQSNTTCQCPLVECTSSTPPSRSQTISTAKQTSTITATFALQASQITPSARLAVRQLPSSASHLEL